MARAARATRVHKIDAPAPSAVALDDVDRRIITALQVDGRRPYGSIANEVSLAEAAVRRRVQRLRDQGALEIVAITDPMQLGYHREAMLGITVSGDVRAAADAIAAIDEAIYVVLTAGSFDLVVEVIAEDDDHLVRVLNDQIRRIDGVVAVETFLYLKLAKQTYSWGNR